MILSWQHWKFWLSASQEWARAVFSYALPTIDLTWKWRRRSVWISKVVLDFRSTSCWIVRDPRASSETVGSRWKSSEVGHLGMSQTLAINRMSHRTLSTISSWQRLFAMCMSFSRQLVTHSPTTDDLKAERGRERERDRTWFIQKKTENTVRWSVAASINNAEHVGIEWPLRCLSCQNVESTVSRLMIPSIYYRTKR